jgi:hypothetical protein
VARYKTASLTARPAAAPAQIDRIQEHLKGIIVNSHMCMYIVTFMQPSSNPSPISPKRTRLVPTLYPNTQSLTMPCRCSLRALMTLDIVFHLQRVDFDFESLRLFISALPRQLQRSIRQILEPLPQLQQRRDSLTAF